MTVGVAKMKGRSLLVLLAIVAVLTIGTVAAAVYIVKDDGDFIVGGDGSSVSESAEIKDLLPGEARTVTHKAKAKGSADFVVALRQGGENSLDQYISVTLKVNEETVFSGTVPEFLENGEVRCPVSGEFGFSVTYSIDESVGNEAQGKKSDLTIIYKIESDVRT